MTTTAPGTAAALVVVAFVLSWWLTAQMRRYALRTHLLDIPNDRSSHSVPTPRGGGLAIVGTLQTMLLAMAPWGMTSLPVALGVGGGGLLVAALGFIDDQRGLSARLRFAGHAVAAVWAVWLMPPLPALPVFGFELALGLMALPLAAIYIVWSVNYFNFMDGIDGIASVQAISMAIGGALVWRSPQGPVSGPWPWCLPPAWAAS